MQLTRLLTDHGPRWAADDRYLVASFSLSHLLQLPAESMMAVIAASRTDETATGVLLAPIEERQEAWAAGVTYLRSREARMAESDSADIYDRVYDAERCEVFFKAAGWRVAGDGQPIRVRRDSSWNVPEPELCLVINAAGEIVGYSAANDVSSRDIEGANPLYLPQAKVYDGSAAIGPAIVLDGPDAMRELPIEMAIERDGDEGAELSFPYGVFLMTGTCIVPPDDFSLDAGDSVSIRVGELELTNPVTA